MSMKTVFLCSSPNCPDGPGLNPANQFTDLLRSALPSPCRMLFICSDPNDTAGTDAFAGSVAQCCVESGIPLQSVSILDGSSAQNAESLVKQASFIVLAGGHVPTQNRFFQQVGLRGLLQHWDGTILGISAGSMNSGDMVYVQPELPGEALDPTFQRWAQGLGLVDRMILPHHATAKDRWLDGMRLFEDITFGDSYGKEFLSIPEGSFLYLQGDRREIRGEAWLISDGAMRQISQVGDVIPF